MIKKKPTKKYAKKKAVKKISGVHKDTKSHNVKINVLSGLNEIDYRIDKYIEKQQKLISLRQWKIKALKDIKKLKGTEKKWKRFDIDNVNNDIINLSNQINTIKKLYKTF
jgi:hypothetical protein